MKNCNIYVFVLLIGAICLTNCKKFVEISPPPTQLVTTSVFNNPAAATAAMTVVYSNMYANYESSTMEVNTGLLSDELTNYNTTPNYLQFYTNALTAAQGPGPWINAYNYIFQANSIITALENNGTLASSIRQQLIGESKFVRAFWFYYLVNFYGDIPLVLTTDYSVNATMSRTPRVKVLEQIISDLKDAQGLLNSNYVDGSDTAVTLERTRPTKWAASALLARAYLLTGDYSDADAQATSIISNSVVYRLCVGLDSVFRANSPEAIWQLATPLPNSYNTLDGYVFILTSAPGGAGSCCTLSPQLINGFEPGDNRRIHWVDSVKTTTTSYYYPYKYKIRTGGPPISEYQMVLRLAEQYLIRAEARTQEGNTVGAITDLNVIRSRAGLANYSGGTDQTSLLNAILHERQIELFTEWGNRWIDLVRTGSVNSVMSVVTPLKGGVWSPDGHQNLFPIPQSERTLDINLSQNAGY